MERRIEELRPFASLGLPLETYRGYESLAVFVGRIQREPELPPGLPSEVFQAPGVIAVFVPKTESERALAALSRVGFTQLDIPAGEGEPQSLLDSATADRDKWKERLKEIQGRLDKLRERFAGFVVAAEEALEVECACDRFQLAIEQPRRRPTKCPYSPIVQAVSPITTLTRSKGPSSSD